MKWDPECRAIYSDSGGQYLDGTCDTTRTIHFGRPTPEQCEAFTRVLQGHVSLALFYISIPPHTTPPQDTEPIRLTSPRL